MPDVEDARVLGRARGHEASLLLAGRSVQTVAADGKHCTVMGEPHSFLLQSDSSAAINPPTFIYPLGSQPYERMGDPEWNPLLFGLMMGQVWYQDHMLQCWSQIHSKQGLEFCWFFPSCWKCTICAIHGFHCFLIRMIADISVNCFCYIIDLCVGFWSSYRLFINETPMISVPFQSKWASELFSIGAVMGRDHSNEPDSFWQRMKVVPLCRMEYK